jgi:hypothetical protein
VEEGVDRGDVDNRPFALLEHLGDGGAGCAQGGEEVELQRALEVGVADRKEAVEPHLHPADVVKEHIDSAVPLDCLADEPLGAARLDQIHLDRGDTVDPPQRVDGKRAGDDARTLRSESAHDGQPDPLAAAGHNRDLSFQLKVHDSRRSQNGSSPKPLSRSEHEPD